MRIGIRLKTGIQNKIAFENPPTMTVSALPNMRRKDCPGKVIFDGHNLARSVRFFPYSLLELSNYSVPGVGTAKFKKLEPSYLPK